MGCASCRSRRNGSSPSPASSSFSPSTPTCCGRNARDQGPWPDAAPSGASKTHNLGLRRKHMSKKLFLGAALGALLVTGASAPARADETYIPLISKGFQHQFWQAVKLGAEQAAKQANVKITFEGPETEAMVDKQIDMLSAALAKKPSAIGLAALDSKAAVPLLKKAHDAKIPVIAFDSGVDSDIPLTTCTTDNLAAAGLAADKMAKAMGDAGEVGVVVHDQT